MARRGKTSTAKVVKLNSKEIWKKVGPHKLQRHLNEKLPHLRWKMSGPNKLTGCCTHHNDSSPSAWADTENGFVRCPSCGMVYTDLTAWLASIHGMTYSEAFRQIIVGELGVRVSKEQEYQAQLLQGQQELFTLIKEVGSLLLTTAASNPSDPEYTFAQRGVAFLRERGIDPDFAALTCGVGIFPRKADVYDFVQGKERGAEIFAMFCQEYIASKIMVDQPKALGLYGGWVIFPHYVGPNTGGRFKLRDPQHGHVSVVGPGKDLGFFGLNWYPSLISKQTLLDSAKKVFVFEGEFDALSFHHEMHSSGVDTVAVSGSGSGMRDVLRLADSGFDHIIVVGDNDQGGEKFAKSAFADAAEEESQAVVFAYEYPPTFQEGDDPDAIIQRGGFDLLKDSLHDKDRWLESHTWAPKQIVREIDRSNTDDLATRLSLVREYADIVREGMFRSNYVETVADELNLSRSQLHCEIATTDTEDGFINLLKSAYSKRFTPVMSDNVHNIRCYREEDLSWFTLCTKSKRDILATLQNKIFQADAYTFISHNMGIPPFIEDDPSSRKGIRSKRSQYAEIEFFTAQAAQSYIAESGIKDADHYHTLRQGVHFLDANDDPNDKEELGKSAPSDLRVIVCNGNRIFLSWIDKEGSTSLNWEALPTPIHSKYAVEGDASQLWSENIMSVEDLNTPVSHEEAKDVFDLLVDLFHECVPFKYRDTGSLFFAAYMFLQPLMMMGRTLPTVFLTGPTTCGKSSVLKGLLRNDEGYGFTEFVEGYDDYTSAGVMQASKGSTRTVALDEFEDADDATGGKRSRVVQAIMEMTRNLAEGSKQARGTATGDHRTMSSQFSLVTASIHTMKREEDLNRWAVFHLLPAHETGETKTVMDKIRERIDKETAARIRRVTTLYGLQNIPAFLKEYHTVYDQLFNKHMVECDAYRFLNRMTSATSIIKYFGRDHLTYISEHVKQHEENLNVSVMSEEERLLRTVLSIKAVYLPDANKPRSVLDIINDSEALPKLSGANCGIYAPRGRNYIVIDPFVVASELLSKSTTYKGITNPKTVYTRLVRHKDVFHDPQRLRNDPQVMNELYRWIPRTNPEELLTMRISDLKKHTEPESDMLPT